MAVVIVQRPDPISLTGNIKELVIQSDKPVGIILSGPRGKTLEETYYPGNGNLVHIGLREVIEADLSFTLPSSDVFIQPRLSGTYTLSYNSEAETGEILFTAIRGGKLNLTESAASFLTGNFLTWQPNCKPVTYYSPEWLTYFAPSECLARLKAYWEDGTNTIIRIAQFSANSCITMNMQYAVISGKFDAKRPMYYDVWIEDAAGTRLSYVQRYIASERQGENEQWYLFENSLGGLDSLRAYGSIQDVPEYTHNLSRRGDESEEYRIDVNRLHTRNTGYLTPDEARWLQDLFPARRKYVYSLSGLLPIVLTESEGHTDTTDLPSSYTFTYRLSDTRPYLDIQRRTDLPENLKLPIPTGETFFLPPRLAEFPKPVLSPDLLIPVEEPHTEVWGATSIGAIHDAVLNDLIRDLDGLDLNPIQGGGGGGLNVDIIKLNDLTIPSDSNVFSSLRTLKEIDDAIDGLIVDIDGMYLRKDIDDIAHGNIKYDQSIGSTIYLDGWEGKGWKITNDGLGELDGMRVRSDIFMGGKIGSPSFASGFTGWGWEIDTPTASGTVDNWTVRKSMKVYEMVYSQIYGLNSSFLVSDWNKVKEVSSLGNDRYRLTIDKEDNMLMNLRDGDVVRMQHKEDGGWSIRYYAALVENVTNETFDLRLLEGDDIPIPGDYVQRIGNKTDKNRQGLIYFTSSDDYAPYIDILDGVTGAQFTQDNTKVRVGNLRGLTINGKPLDMYGIYINGGIFQHSTYYLDDGTTIEQQFSILDGKLDSSIEEIRKDLSEQSGNILRNASFSTDLNYWNTDALIHFITLEEGFLWIPNSFYVDKERTADIYRDGIRNVLRIKNAAISQPNGVMNIPAHEGEEDLKTYSFALYYKVLRAGSYEFGIPGTDLYASGQMEVGDTYQKLSKVGKWNGKGDFELRFTGEILIYGLAMFADEMADAVIRLETQIQQTSEYIKLLATKEYVDTESGKIYTKYDASLTVMAEEIAARVSRKDFDTETGAIRQEIASGLSIQAGSIQVVSTKVDNINHTIETAGWINSTQGNALYAAKTLENGQNIISYINQTPGSTTINSNRINLVGAVSFSMLSDYTTVNNRINGKASMSDVTNALSNYVTNSSLNNKLSNYALASTLSDYVQSTTLANTLKNYATNIAAEDVANSAATAEFKRLADAIVNGNTTVLGGFVSTKIIDTDSIYANQAYIGKYKIKDGWLVGETSGGANDTYALMKLRHTKSSDGSFSQITLGSNVNNSLFSNQRVTARIYNGVSNKSSLADWGDYYRNTALQLEANYGDINIALETIGGRMHRGRLWEIEEITPITGGGTYNTQKNGSFFLFRDLKADLTFELPTFSTIQSMFGNFQSGVSASQYGLYSIRILIDRYCSYRVLVAGTSTTPLLNNDGEIQNDASGTNYGARWMARGDFMVLAFYNKAWYIQSLSN